MTSLEALGAAVRQLREARGISREDLEAESGVSVSTQIRLENHGRRINHPNMAALLRALNIRVTTGGDEAARGAGGALRRAGWSVSRPV